MLNHHPTHRAPTVLVVEDDDGGRALVQTLLEREGYGVLVAADGLSGLRLAREHEPDVIILDVGLPRLDGLEVARTLRKAAPTRTIPILVLTAGNSQRKLVAALDAGADDFVTKPFAGAELLARVRSATRMRRAILGMETSRSAITALVGALGAKDANTERHCQRLAGLASRLGGRLGLSTDERETLEFAAVLHDVGKIGIPDAILRKPGDLSQDEWAYLRRHSQIGAEICRPLGISDKLIPIIRHHHERWDGTGYPDGLRGDAAPLGARVVAVLDAYDAMTHHRPYRGAFSPERALDEIRSHAGQQFDPDIASIFETEILSTEAGPPARAFDVVPAARRVSGFERAQI